MSSQLYLCTGWSQQRHFVILFPSSGTPGVEINCLRYRAAESSYKSMRSMIFTRFRQIFTLGQNNAPMSSASWVNGKPRVVAETYLWRRVITLMTGFNESFVSTIRYRQQISGISVGRIGRTKSSGMPRQTVIKLMVGRAVDQYDGRVRIDPLFKLAYKYRESIWRDVSTTVPRRVSENLGETNSVRPVPSRAHPRRHGFRCFV